jgi:hypothetical protein
MNPYGIHSICDMVSRGDVMTQDQRGRWVRAVPEPYTGSRLRAAWWVLIGRAYAVRWPRPGDYERAGGLEAMKR